MDDYSWRDDIKQIIKWYYEQSKSNRFETDVEFTNLLKLQFSNLLNCPWKKLNKYSGLKEMEYHPFFPPQIKLKVMMSYLVFFQINKEDIFQSYRSSSWELMKKTLLISWGWKTFTPKFDKDGMRKQSGHPISYRNIDVIDFAKKKKKKSTHQIQKYLNI